MTTIELKYSTHKISNRWATSQFLKVGPGLQLSDSCLYVADLVNNAVHKVDLSTTPPTTTKWSVAEPVELSLNREGNLLVTSDSLKILKYTPSGSLVREISVNSKLWQALELNDGTFVASRYHPEADVLRMSVNGAVLRRYYNITTPGVRQMTRPSGLAVDSSQGYVLVAAMSLDKILVVNLVSSEIRVLPLPASVELESPVCVWLDESASGIHGVINAVCWYLTTSSTSALFSLRDSNVCNPRLCSSSYS